MLSQFFAEGQVALDEHVHTTGSASGDGTRRRSNIIPSHLYITTVVVVPSLGETQQIDSAEHGISSNVQRVRRQRANVEERERKLSRAAFAHSKTLLVFERGEVALRDGLQPMTLEPLKLVHHGFVRVGLSMVERVVSIAVCQVESVEVGAARERNVDQLLRMRPGIPVHDRGVRSYVPP